MNNIEQEVASKMVYIGSVRLKNKKKRTAFIVNGFFPTKASFIEALKRELEGDYDMRSLRYHDAAGFMRSPQLMTLDFLVEELQQGSGTYLGSLRPFGGKK